MNYNIHEDLFESEHISKELKIKLVVTHRECILLYKSGLWTLTKTLKQQIANFFRRILRRGVSIHWLER